MTNDDAERIKELSEFAVHLAEVINVSLLGAVKGEPVGFYILLHYRGVMQSTSNISREQLKYILQEAVDKMDITKDKLPDILSNPGDPAGA